mgnify:CR=1 FL=1
MRVDFDILDNAAQLVGRGFAVHVDHRDAVGADVEHGHVGVHARHAAHAGQRIGAGVDQLALAFAGLQFHHDEDVLRADGQIHRAAHGGDGVGRAGVPVGQVAVLRHLEGAQHADVQVAAAHHRERVGVVEERAAGQFGDGLLAGVDQVVVFLALGRRGAHAQHAVLGVQDDFAVGRQVVGHQRRQADAEVDVPAVLELARGARGHLVAGERHQVFVAEEVEAGLVGPGAGGAQVGDGARGGRRAGGEIEGEQA